MSDSAEEPTKSTEATEHGVRPDAFDIAFRSVFCSVATLFRETGIVRHQLVGLEFRLGRAVDAHIEVIRESDRVPVLIERMRCKWAMVAHVQPVELHRDKEGPSILAICIYNIGGYAISHCAFDARSRRIAHGALVRHGALNGAEFR